MTFLTKMTCWHLYLHLMTLISSLDDTYIFTWWHLYLHLLTLISSLDDTYIFTWWHLYLHSGSLVSRPTTCVDMNHRCACMYVRIQVHMYITSVETTTGARACMYAYVYICMLTGSCVYMITGARACLYPYVYMCIHMCTYVYCLEAVYIWS